VLTRHGIDPKDLDTLHVVENYEEPNERVLDRSDAILRAGRELGGIWELAADLGMKVPPHIRDRFYRFVAKNRYYMFGKYQTCMLPEPQHRPKFLDTV
jgi:predicted DCC family thiol-disulfide oxidoreductase YuxK